MGGWRRLVAVSGVAAVLLGSGLAAWSWGRLDPLLIPLQRGLAPRGMVDDERLGEVEREQLIRLSAENVLLRTRLEEYQAIRGETGVPAERSVVARGRIVARSLRAGRRYLELAVGAVDGVARGMAVASGWTLVGLVTGVQEGRCLVQLLSDRECRLPAAIIATREGGPRLLAEGVLTGTGQRGGLVIEQVEQTGDLVLAPGMAVVTAGSDGRLPAGLVLGTVAEADRADGDRWRIAVQSARDAELAESLLVLRFPPR